MNSRKQHLRTLYWTMIQYRVFVIYFFLMMLIQDRTYTYDNTVPSHMYTQGTTEKNEEDHVTESSHSIGISLRF